MPITKELLDELMKGCERPEDRRGDSGPMKEPKIKLMGSIRNFVLWAIVMKKKGASYGNREGTIGPAVGGA